MGYNWITLLLCLSDHSSVHLLTEMCLLCHFCHIYWTHIKFYISTWNFQKTSPMMWWCVIHLCWHLEIISWQRLEILFMSSSGPHILKFPSLWPNHSPARLIYGITRSGQVDDVGWCYLFIEILLIRNPWALLDQNNFASIHGCVMALILTRLTFKHWETHGCIVSTLATDALWLKQQAISILNAD